jgi:glycosyltransferase involved in cell wall biosynthesis
MKVGFLQPWDSCTPPNVGGSLGIWTWEVARRLARSHEVLVCSRRAPGMPAQVTVEGVRFLHFYTHVDQWLLRTRRRVGLAKGLPEFASRFYFATHLLRSALAMRILRCDVVHIFNVSQFTPIVASLNFKATIVLNMHCDWLAGLNYKMVNRRLKYVDRILGCSDWITNKIKLRFPHHAERCRTLYNGFDVEKFYSEESNNNRQLNHTLLSVGRISPEKGLHVLLDAFDQVYARKPSCHLRIVGNESVLPPEAITEMDQSSQLFHIMNHYGRSYLQKLRDRASRSSLQNISFLGALSQSQVAAEMRDATILVQPSLYETFGMPAIEAMGAGLPVIASRVGALSEIVVHGETGLLVEPDNSNALAEAIIMLLNDPVRARAMGMAGKRRAMERFSWEAIIHRLTSHYSVR